MLASGRTTVGTVDDLAHSAQLIGERLFGRKAATVVRRDPVTIELDFGDEPIVARRCRSPEAAAVEAEVATVLGSNGAPVPKLLACEGPWLFERAEPGASLVERLADAVEAEGERWLYLALQALTRIHSVAAATGLAERAFPIGASAGWLDDMVAAPERLGAFLAIPCPPFDRAGARAALDVKGPSFIKWDAEPATALARPDWSVVWRGFAHCGRRNRIDDVVTLLADERVPDWPTAERRLIERQTKFFDERHYPEGAEAYLRLAGVLRATVRLSGLIKEMLKQGEWNYLAGHGFQGRPPPAFAHLCRRAARWAEAAPLTRPLGPWWREVGYALVGERV